MFLVYRFFFPLNFVANQSGRTQPQLTEFYQLVRQVLPNFTEESKHLGKVYACISFCVVLYPDRVWIWNSAVCFLFVHFWIVCMLSYDSDFFSLGGDSVSSIRLSSLIKQTYSVSIPISVIVQDKLSVESIEALVITLQETGEDLHELKARKRMILMKYFF
jgi:hypothetical protein